MKSIHFLSKAVGQAHRQCTHVGHLTPWFSCYSYNSWSKVEWTSSMAQYCLHRPKMFDFGEWVVAKKGGRRAGRIHRCKVLGYVPAFISLSVMIESRSAPRDGESHNYGSNGSCDHDHSSEHLESVPKKRRCIHIMTFIHFT